MQSFRYSDLDLFTLNLSYKALTSYGSGEDDSAEDFDEVDIVEEAEASLVAGLGEDN